MNQLENRRATREEIEKHHQRRAQAIERRALEAATRAIEGKLTVWERIKRWWRK